LQHESCEIHNEEAQIKKLGWRNKGQRKFFTSLDDANAMLDLPTDRAKLRRKQLVIAKALNFLA
jgi:hypothetical protein